MFLRSLVLKNYYASSVGRELPYNKKKRLKLYELSVVLGTPKRSVLEPIYKRLG